MKLAIFGSRSLIGEPVRRAIRDAVVRYAASEIVTAGEPQGVCDEARHVAKELSVPLKLYWLNAKERAAGKYHWRSVAVLKDCDACLFIHDGKSVGTRNEIKLAVKLGTAHEVEHMSPAVTVSMIETAIAALSKEWTDGIR